ncbi:MAG TPA: PKD domain-containing protein [Solirubrobacterales bacterium]
MLGKFARLSFLMLLVACVAPASGAANFAVSAGGEPAVTNTPTNSHFFDWNSQGGNVRYCITVERGGSSFERGCIPSASTYYLGGSGQFSQTENSLPNGTVVVTRPSEYIDGIGLYPCSGEHCRSGTLIDLGAPVLTVYAAGTANYTNNPQIPMHIDYNDALSHPWFAGGDAAAVYICARRDRGCTNADLHSYTPNCSHANLTRFAAPGNAKVNSFDCTFDFSSEADGPVYLCASAADQSIPDPDPNANESLAVFPTHVNQFVNPATGQGWTAGDANLADSSCGSVLLDRAPPAIGVTASDTTPATGDLVTFSASGSDGGSGISGPYTWSFGDNTAGKEGTNITHTYSAPGTYHVELTTHDGAGNTGTAGVDLVVKTEGGSGDEGTVTVKPPSKDAIGGKLGTQTTSLGELKVIAPKKYKLSKKPKPILMTLIASSPGAFQAALTKGPKTVAKGAGVLAGAGTFGFKLKLPKRLTAGTYKLRLTFVPDGASAGTTKTISIPFIRPRARKHASRSQRPAARGAGTVNVDAGPPAAGYGH